MTARPAAADLPRGGRPPLLRLLAMARPLRGRLLGAAAAGAAATGCGVALLAVSGFLLARASQHPNIIAISVAVVAVRALSIGRGLSRYLERLASHDVAFRVLAQVRVALWRRLEALAPAGVTVFRSGDLLARLISDVDATQDLFIRGVTPVLAAALVGGGAVTVCLVILAPAAAVLAAGLLIAGIVVPLAGVALARRAARWAAPTRGRLAATVTDLLGGAADLHAFGAADAALARAETMDTELTRADGRTAAASALGAGLMSAVTGLTVWGVLLLGVAATGTGALSRVPLAVLTLTALAAFEAVTALPAAAVQLGQARVAAGRIAAVTDTPDPVRDPPCPRALPPGPFGIQFRGATVRYRPDGPPALDRVSLDLPPGRRVALVGANGAGKSTVAAALMRFCELSSGAVLLDGHHLASYAADDIRSIIGGCPQDPHLFDTTIRDNLRLARPDATDDELQVAAARAGLLAWIASLPRQWDTPVGTHGAAVSGGERQRLALARAFLADPPLLILDEPTAHLDPAIRRALTADLLHATEGRSVLLITHELDGLDQVDHIVVLDRGKITEQGTHQQLRRAGGPYQRMWDREDQLGLLAGHGARSVEQRAGARFEQRRVADPAPQRRVHERQDDPDGQGDPGSERVPVEGGGGQRGEGVLDDIAEDGQADEENDGFDRRHAPSDGEDDGGDDDQDVGRDDQIGPVGEAERDGPGGQRLGDEQQQHEQAARTGPDQRAHRGARSATGPAQHDRPGVTPEREQDA
jgi:ATP-binding cassette, subfamily C, bacterial CydC